MNILILGASYGSLLSTKLLMVGHDVSLVCRSATADLINTAGTFVEIKSRGEDSHTTYSSTDLSGTVRGIIPTDVNPSDYDLVVLAMQEPQYSESSLKDLMSRIAKSSKPCLSLMNMPPLPYLRRIPSLKSLDLDVCYHDSSVWDGFDPDLVSLCSPDPQAFRPPDKGANLLHVGLPTNFKTAPFANSAHNAILTQLSQDIDDAASFIGKEVPVKLRVSDSLFVPFAKWSMLMCGNYRCVLRDSVRPISDAVHSDLSESQMIYDGVGELVLHLGGSADDAVPFDKYATASKGLLNPSSVARAIAGGVSRVERVDRLIYTISESLSSSGGPSLPWLLDIVTTIEHRLSLNASS